MGGEVMKVVINGCYGGFGLSQEAKELYAKKKGFELFFYKSEIGSEKFTRIEKEERFGSFSFTKDLGEIFEGFQSQKDYYWSDYALDRTDPMFIEVVEELGEKANSWASELKIVEIPDGTNYTIDNYDGIESIHEVHNAWY